MKAKKPLLLAVLALALLALALVLPATAVGASDSAVINRASFGMDSNNNWTPYWQIMTSFLVKEGPEGEFTGHLTTQTQKTTWPGVPIRTVAHGHEIVAAYFQPVPGYPDQGSVTFVVKCPALSWDEHGAPLHEAPHWTRVYAFDGGTGRGGDVVILWSVFGQELPPDIDDLPAWGMAIPLVPIVNGNVEIHITGLDG